MSPDTTPLCQVLEDLVRLLAEHEEENWSQAISKVLGLVRQGELRAVRSFLRMYGGMGSFNDLVIHTKDYHSTPSARMIAINEDLDGLRKQAFTLAVDVLHQASSGPAG